MSFAGSIIRDVSTSVAAIYLLIEDVLEYLSVLAHIVLLATVYCLVRYCYQRSNAKPHFKFVKWLHFIICLILFGIWVAILYYSITFEVHFILLDQSSDELLKTLDIERKLVVAYTALFLCASIEVLMWTVTISLSSREQGNNDPVGEPGRFDNTCAKYDQTGVLLVGLVGAPLFIGSIWSLATSSASLHHTLSDKVLFVNLLFVRVSTVVVYGGIVIIAKRLEQDHVNAGGFMAPIGQNHMSPNQWQSQPLMYDGGTPGYQTGALPHAFNGPSVGPPNGFPNGAGGMYWPNQGHPSGGYAPVAPEVGVNGAQPASNHRGRIVDV